MHCFVLCHHQCFCFTLVLKAQSLNFILNHSIKKKVWQTSLLILMMMMMVVRKVKVNFLQKLRLKGDSIVVIVSLSSSYANSSDEKRVVNVSHSCNVNILFTITIKISYCTLLEMVALPTNALKWMSSTGNPSLWESGEAESLFLLRKGLIKPCFKKKKKGCCCLFIGHLQTFVS